MVEVERGGREERLRRKRRHFVSSSRYFRGTFLHPRALYSDEHDVPFQLVVEK